MDQRYDVIIIGSGTGGDTLARRLAPSGKNILILERGDWLKRRGGELGCHGGVRPEPSRPTRYGKPFQQQVHYFVGGATVCYFHGSGNKQLGGRYAPRDRERFKRMSEAWNAAVSREP